MMGLKSCGEVSELVSQGLDRELGFGERLPEDDPQARAGAQST